MPTPSSDLDNVDIVTVARLLGIQTERSRNKQQVKAICPFHKEDTPSLTFFGKSGGVKPHYHCFGCQAHGGILDLIVERGRAATYREALQWLEAQGLISETSAKGGGRVRALTASDAIAGFLKRAKEAADPALLQTFANSRRFNVELLNRAGLLAADLNTVSRGLSYDTDEVRLLIQHGLVRRADGFTLGKEQSAPTLSAFVPGIRIVVPVRDFDGRYVGAIARASKEGQTPKYKFPTGFERGRHLFGAHEVAAAIRGLNGVSGERFFDLYLTEGVFDALRIRSTKHWAVAAFGASITAEQVKLIEKLATLATDQSLTLRLHLFFDMDKAGRDGTARALARLLESAAEWGYLVDVVRPRVENENTKDNDPDGWIARQAEGHPVDLDAFTYPALHALITAYIDDSIYIGDVEAYWQQLSWPEKFSIGRRLRQRLKDIDFDRILKRIRPDLTSLVPADTPPSNSLLQELTDQLSPRLGRERKATQPEQAGGMMRPPASLETRLNAAVELAFEASNSREYPVDVASWERIKKAAPVFLPLLQSRLLAFDGPIRPYTAHYIPRSNGKTRLKCGPCPEDAILQQHVLTELLRHTGDEAWLETVPAVRWWPDQRKITTTGRGDPGGETVSFGYQIDMSALEGRPDRASRRDMFRPFIECWNSYIAYVGRHISRMGSSSVHVARLDVHRYYDEIPRRHIAEMMGQPLRKLLLRGNEFALAAGFYEINRDVEQNAAERILDWIMAHSFGDLDVGYSYIDPLDAGVRTWGRRGRGLPQGPPLSAYLGTIALFDLDKRMVQEVEYLNQRRQEALGGSPQGKRRCAAVYARYVDDIILVATSEVDLRHLLNCATEELTKAGLRDSNDKLDVMIPKTIIEAREWLVEHRGAGFGYGSNSVEDMPAPLLSTTILDTESMGLDRRQLLAITLDPKLDDPSISSQFVIRRLEQVAQAARELRESDFGFLARRMLMRLSLDVAADLVGSETNSQGTIWVDRRLREFAIKIVDTWLDKLWLGQRMFQPDGEDGRAEQQANEALHNSACLIALFDGVERLLASRPEQNPAYEENARNELANARDRFIDAVRHGLLVYVRTVCDERLGAERSTLWAQLTQTQIILEERADIIWQQKKHKVVGNDPDRMGRAKLQMPDTSGSLPPAFWRLLSSWYCHFQLKPKEKNIYPGIEDARDQLVAALKYSGDGAWAKEVPFAALHMTISLLEALRIVPGRQQNDVNIRRELSALLSGDSLPPKFGDAPEGTSITLVLKMWFGSIGDPTYLNTDISNRAAITYIMIVNNSDALSELLPYRPEIISELANGPNAQLLPPPPAPGTSRLIFKTEDKLTGLVLLSNEEEDHGFYLDFPWRLQETKNVGTYTTLHYQADLEGFKPLLLANGRSEKSVEKHVSAIVSTLLLRAIEEHAGDPSMPPLVTPYSIFFRLSGEEQSGTDLVQIRLATWKVPAEEVRGEGYRRSGRVLVAQRTFHPELDWLWRPGMAIADILSPAQIGPSQMDEAAEAADMHPDIAMVSAILRRKLFSRIQGAYLPRTITSAYLQTTNKLPRHIQRVLDAYVAAMEEVEERRRPIIVEHFMEGRAMVLRQRVLPDLESMASGPVGLLARFGQMTLGAYDHELPPDNAAFERIKFSRPTEAYRRVSAALMGYAEKAKPDVSLGLMISATAARLWAMTLAWRECALALLVRLDGQQRQALLRYRPGLKEWGVEEKVYLIDPSFGWTTADAEDFIRDAQSKELMVTLAKALGAERLADAQAELDRITLLGWVVVTAMALALIPLETTDDLREAFPRRLPESTVTGLSQKLAALAGVLSSGTSSTVKDEETWPWDLFSAIVGGEPDRHAEETLQELVTQVGLEWVHPQAEGRVLRELDSRDGRFSYEPRSAPATWVLGHWQFLQIVMPHEKKPKREVFISENDGQEFQVWTVVKERGTPRPLVISVASAALARLTHLPLPSATKETLEEPGSTDRTVELRSSAEERREIPGVSGSSASAPAEAAYGITPQAESAGGGGGNGSPPTDIDTTEERSDAPRPPDGDTDRSPSDMSLRLSDWKTLRDKAWAARTKAGVGRKVDGNCRIAFLQIDFAEAYDDPVPPTKNLVIKDGMTQVTPLQDLVWPDVITNGENLSNEERNKLKGHGELKLCPHEWRRRRVLAEVVDACGKLHVDALLLPEYSMRPETVLWLARLLDDKRSSLSVWAGTFRVPSKFKILVDRLQMTGKFVSWDHQTNPGYEVWKSLSAVLPVIFREKEGTQASVEELSGFAVGDQDSSSESHFLFNRLSNRIVGREKRYPAIAYEETIRPADTAGGFAPLMSFSKKVTRPETYIAELICSEIFAFNGPMNFDAISRNISRMEAKFGMKYISRDNQWIDSIRNDNESLAKYMSHETESKNLPRRTILMLPCITRRSKDYHAFGITMHLSAGTNIVFCNSSLKGPGGGESCIIGFRSWDETPNKSKFGPYHGVLPGLYQPLDMPNVAPLGKDERALVIVDIDPVNSALPHPRPQYIPEPVRLVAHLPIMENASVGKDDYDWKVDDEFGELIDQVHQVASIQGIKSTLELQVSKNNHVLKDTQAALKSLEDKNTDSPAMKSRAKAFKEHHRDMPESWPPPVLTDFLPVDFGAAGFNECVKKLKAMGNIDDTARLEPDQYGLPLIWVEPPQPPDLVNDDEATEVRPGDVAFIEQVRNLGDG